MRSFAPPPPHTHKSLAIEPQPSCKSLEFCDAQTNANAYPSYVRRNAGFKSSLYSVAISIISALFLLLPSQLAKGQCTGQDPLDCDCEQTTDYNLKICVDQDTGTIILKVCNQFPNPNLIRNPCTNCTQPVDVITYVKEICFPPIFDTVTYSDILPGIVCATYMCRNPNYLGVVIPDCLPAGTNACTADNPYCHIISFPRCVKRVGNCWKSCQDGCDNRCMVWRQHCKHPQTGCWTCLETGTCLYNEQAECPEGCEEIQYCPYAHPPCCI